MGLDSYLLNSRDEEVFYWRKTPFHNELLYIAGENEEKNNIIGKYPLTYHSLKKFLQKLKLIKSWPESEQQIIMNYSCKSINELWQEQLDETIKFLEDLPFDKYYYSFLF